ncbi:enolase C-terminal domain-like protein [Streptomyces chartreusis]|uniref:Mandelate racemase n=1 Tax=Streptomyces chartreusis TaxID=1969 RepID=A0A7I0NSJ0_STRCX|nr:enolase C-terminal domain-like protein [Streptomyces chartreusis]QKZ16033.1 mandelate racemase [Streptomyces chartreusis]
MNTPYLLIRSVQARAVDVPLSRPIRTAVGDIPTASLVLVDIDTHEGVRGRSYIFGYTDRALGALVRFITDIGPELIGKPVAPVERMRDFDRRFKLLGWQGLVGMAVGGLDMALWDALGQAAAAPVVQLLGGEPKPLPAYDSYGVVDPADDALTLENAVGRGFGGIKVKLDGDTAEDDVKVVREVREIIGSDVALMVDYNQSLTPTEALKRINRLADFDLTWVEEPVPADDIHGHARVRNASPVPVQTGENWWFPRGMANAIAARASDLCMLDIMKIGGVSGWIQAMGQADAASLPVSSHLFIEASAHTLAVTPTAHWLEHLDLAGPLLAEPVQPIDGKITPRGPGLGMTWDEQAVARFIV